MALYGCRKNDPTEPNNETEEKKSALLFELTEPVRNSIIEEGTIDEYLITVSGKACDSLNSVIGVTINQSVLSLQANGDCQTFSTEMGSKWGMNIIDGLAENDIGGKISLVQSYIRSPEFYTSTYNGGEATIIPAAWSGRFGQEIIDDGDRADIDDMASIISLAINNVDFGESIPQILANSITTSHHDCWWPLSDQNNKSGVKLERNGLFESGDITINSVLAKADKIDLDFDIASSKLPLVVDAYQDLYCVPPFEVHEHATGYFSLGNTNVTASLNILNTDNGIEVTLGESNINLPTPTIFINISGISWLENLVSNILSAGISAFTSGIESSLNDFLNSELSDLLMSTIESFGMAQTMIIPEPVNLQLDVYSSLNTLVSREGSIDIELGANVKPAIYKKDQEQLIYGSIVGEQMQTSYESEDTPYALGVQDEYFNQVFWAVWAGGGFDVQDGNNDFITGLTNSTGLEAEILSIETGLPPVLMASDTDTEFKICTGEILIRSMVNPTLLGEEETGINPVEISTYVSIIFSGNLVIEEGTDEFTILQTNEAEIHVQIQDHELTDASIDLEEKFASFAKELFEDYLSAVVREIDIPSFSIGGLVDMPDGTEWALSNGSINYYPGYHKIVGNIAIREK